ncbi:hypothetical protein AVEN_3221-1 [Araneus ventricosus]|uniref:Uncharacterized protein n=1 Tax=Araneus ventricosus TaxID=182803 RepID=A0A4Y2G7S1_ARAVE|nr:hypothetical protein AVEN_3221-1 [Araneus ventricosus]
MIKQIHIIDGGFLPAPSALDNARLFSNSVQIRYVPKYFCNQGQTIVVFDVYIDLPVKSTKSATRLRHAKRYRTPLHAPVTITFRLCKQCGGHEVEETSKDVPQLSIK